MMSLFHLLSPSVPLYVLSFIPSCKQNETRGEHDEPHLQQLLS